MYFRRLRSQVDQILAPRSARGTQRREARPGEAAGDGRPGALADGPPGATSSGGRCCSTPCERGDRCSPTRPCRPSQSARPNVVVNEIQHSPAGGGDAEFLELYNPSATESVDISGSSIGDGTTLTVKPDTVPLPRRSRDVPSPTTPAVFAANDPTFRNSYADSVLVSGTYDGRRDRHTHPGCADATVADTVSHGGAGWPTSTGGRSLELRNRASDNNVGANWVLSVRPGTPGASSS